MGKVSIMENVVTVEVFPNYSTENRWYEVHVTAGDIFYYFVFNQAAVEPTQAWNPMEWETDVVMDEKGRIPVSAKGGTYVFTCTSYQNPWISQIWQRDAEWCRSLYEVKEDDIYNLETPWGKVSVEGNKVTVELYPRDFPYPREYKVCVTAGDILYSFILI